jgi:putative methionine-R-sulfoxide reductase with GAF domain
VSSRYDTAERVLAEGGEADEVLRALVETLADEPGIDWAGVAFLDEGLLVLGPRAGEPDEARRMRVTVRYEGAAVGELWADGDVDVEALERVAERAADYVLVGWDTGGESWEP